MNTNYVYWDIDTTNWNAMYNTYKPIFAQLNLNNNADLTKSVQYFQAMTDGLIDGHYNISFLNPAIKSYSINPSFNRKKSLPGFHYPYSYINLDTKYLDAGYHLGQDNSIVSNGQPLTALCGTISNKILYFSCNQFSLFNAYNATTANGVQPVLQNLFTTLSALPANIKGIVIDVRGNLGGDVDDLNFIIGRLISSPLLFGYTQSKSGNGRLDYTPWVEAYVNPEPNAQAINVPIIVLADMMSASLSEAYVATIKALPNSTFIGEQTWGATGPIADEAVYNDGQFIVNGFMSVYTSSCKFKYLDGKIHEGIGYTPDISIPYNQAAINAGNDTQLEKAISLIQ
jgi:hypothetical protein